MRDVKCEVDANLEEEEDITDFVGPNKSQKRRSGTQNDEGECMKASTSEVDLKEKNQIVDVKPSKSPRKKKKSRKRKDADEEEYRENSEHAKKIQKKFSNKNKKRKDTNIDENSYLRLCQSEQIGSSVYKIVNSAAHDSGIQRAQEQQLKRLFQAEFVDDPLRYDSAWCCALCGRHRFEMELGPLFGPSIISLPSSLPRFLTKSKKKIAFGRCTNIDLWFHLDCVLWAPGVFLDKDGLTNLDKLMPRFWTTKCTVCRNEGATISCGKEKLHFPCARSKGYEMDTSTLSCRPPPHR